MQDSAQSAHKANRQAYQHPLGQQPVRDDKTEDRGVGVETGVEQTRGGGRRVSDPTTPERPDPPGGAGHLRRC